MKTIIQSLLRPLGLRLVRLDNLPAPDYGPAVLFSILKRFGFSPRHVLDVGANHGNWTRSALKFFPDAQYTLLEPQDRLKLHIQDLLASRNNIRWINAGASDQSGTQPFYVSHRDDSSSFVFPGDDSVPSTLVQVLSLDDLLVSYRLPVPDLVKIDAEGFDLRVLHGAGSLLSKTEVFLVEVSVLCPYENSFLKTVAFMHDHGYRLLDITELNRSPRHGVLWLAELAFLRSASPLLASVDSYE